jgi:hypothetical protein
MLVCFKSRQVSDASLIVSKAGAKLQKATEICKYLSCFSVEHGVFYTLLAENGGILWVIGAISVKKSTANELFWGLFYSHYLRFVS